MNMLQGIRCLLCTAAFGLTFPAQAQLFNIDPIKYDSFGQIVTLRWETGPERVWSIESSSDLIDWSQAQTGPDALLRVASSGSNHTEVQFSAPVDSSVFYRVRILQMTGVGTLAPSSRDLPQVHDANDKGRVVGQFDPYAAGGGIGFTWTSGEEMVSFGRGSAAIAVNNQDMVVGTRPGPSIFSWTPTGGIVDRGPGLAKDVNEAGNIIG
jgi:hypothetical protein